MTDNTALRDRIAAALYERERSPRDRAWTDAYAMDREVFEAMADAVMAVLPAPADRVAVLREAAAAIEAEQAREEATAWAQSDEPDPEVEVEGGAVRHMAALLRRMAAGAQPTGQHQPRRGDAFEAWLKAQRDDHNSHGTNDHEMYDAIDALLDQYRLHADTGTPLGEHVCEGRVVGDCECLEPAAGAPVPEQHEHTWTVKESTRRYAEELRATPGQASADGHTGWECDAGASLLVAASTPGPGALGTHHGTIYTCAAHQGAAVERITGAGYDADPQPAPPGHRWNPWPCGHVTAHGADALTALTSAGQRQDGARP